MIVLGLVGRIGAGKSTVARLLGERGATVIDADRIAHEVLREPEVVDAVRDGLGAGVLAVDGTLDRRKIAELVFGPTRGHADALATLEKIVHPRVIPRIEALLAAERMAAVDGPERIVVLDVPLLLKSGLIRRCTHLLEVGCDEPVRRDRLAARGWGREEIAARDAAWERARGLGDASDGAEPGPVAGFLDASGDVRYTSPQVDQFLRDIAAVRHPGRS